MRLQCTQETTDSENNNLEVKLDRKPTKMSSKIISDTSNKSIEMINRNDNIYEENKMLSYRDFQKATQSNQEKLEEDKNSPDDFKLSHAGYNNYEEESSEDEQNENEVSLHVEQK